MDLFLRFISTFSVVSLISLAICLIRGIFDQLAYGTPFWTRLKFYCEGMMWCAIHATIALCVFSLTFLAGHISGYLLVFIFPLCLMVTILFAFSAAILWVMSHYCVIADIQSINDFWEHV
jgi:hypothetical protein